MTFLILAEIDAGELFEDDTSVDLQFCKKHATFRHKEACEYILYSGSGPGSEDYVAGMVKRMKRFGCTKEFIRLYQTASDAGATHVLFYV